MSDVPNSERVRREGSDKLAALYDVDGETLVGYYFWCPGCETLHGPMVARGVTNEGGPVWSFNGDLERPTFSPSILVNADRHNEVSPRCHLFLRDGKLEFLPDSTHKLAGQTVDLPDLPDWA